MLFLAGMIECGKEVLSGQMNKLVGIIVVEKESFGGKTGGSRGHWRRQIGTVIIVVMARGGFDVSTGTSACSVAGGIIHASTRWECDFP